MAEIKDRFGAVTARICYPPVATTALGTIPGGSLMYALSAQILKERMKMATKLAQVQRDLSAGVDAGVIQAQVDAMTRDLLQEDAPKRAEAKEKAQPDEPEAPAA